MWGKGSSKRGSTLVVAVILLLVLAVLSIGIFSVAFAEHKLVLAEERTTQAYYTARSIVSGTFDWLRLNIWDTDEYKTNVPTELGWDYGKHSSGSIDGMTYDLWIWRDEATTSMVHVRSKAVNTVEGTPYSATVELTYISSDVGLFDDTIYSKEDIEAEGSSNSAVGGNVRSEQSIDYKLNVVGGVPIPNSPPIDFPPIDPPPGTVYADEYFGTQTWTTGTVISGNTKYNGQLNATGEVTIQNTTDLIIWIDSMSYDELTITTTGQGRVFIFVQNDFESQKTKSKIDIVNSDNLPYTYLILNSENSVVLNGNNILQLYLYAPTSEISFGGCPGLSGALIVNEFALNGNVVITKVEPNLAGSPFEAVSNALAAGMTISRKWLP